jgi:hypothetical protein
VRAALTADPAACRAHALKFSWDASVQQFVSHIRQFPAETYFPEPAAADAAVADPAPAQ